MICFCSVVLSPSEWSIRGFLWLTPCFCSYFHAVAAGTSACASFWSSPPESCEHWCYNKRRHVWVWRKCQFDFQLLASCDLLFQFGFQKCYCVLLWPNFICTIACYYQLFLNIKFSLYLAFFFCSKFLKLWINKIIWKEAHEYQQ